MREHSDPRTAGADAGRVLVFGDVIDDIIVIPRAPIRPDTDTIAQIDRRAGGSASNVASWLGALGVEVDFLGHVGAADVTRHVAEFASHGVRAHLVGHDDLPTGTIVVIVDPALHSRTMLTEKGANVVAGPADVTASALEGISHVHFTGYTIFSGAPPADFQAMIARVHAAGATVSVDPSSVGFLADGGLEMFQSAVHGCDVLLPNLDEGMVLTALTDPAAIVEALTARFPVVAMSLGADGAIVHETGGAPFRVPTLADTPIDTTGAGDAFAAGFLASWLVDGDVRAAAESGSRASARAVSATGARPVR